MAESVPVRCPVCSREQLYAPPSYPCTCGAPVQPPVARSTPKPVTHRTWADEWVSVECEACGREDEWPQPELGCTCGTVLRIPVAAGTTTRGRQAPSLPVHIPLPRTASSPRPAFQPVTIRTARDAVTAVALYLRWLGYRDIRTAEHRTSSGIGLMATGLVAQVEPSLRPATLRDVECLWLTGTAESALSVYFSLAGYAADARVRADELGVPLFVVDLTGTPQPVNSRADELYAAGA